MSDGISIQTRVALKKLDDELNPPAESNDPDWSQNPSTIHLHKPSIGKLTERDKESLSGNKTKEQITNARIGKISKGVYGD